MNYDSWEDFDLLEALELAGQTPDPDLIRACLDRGGRLTPGLLDMLSRGTQPHWRADDPRWFRDAHAGLLLIEQREEAAIPIFDSILRDPSREQLVAEWFEIWLPAYGTDIVPMLMRLAGDADAYGAGRATAVRLLGVLGTTHEEVRPEITASLRRLLPDDLEDAAGASWSGDITLWTWAASSLQSLNDEESKEHLAEMHKKGLLDEDTVGSLNFFLSEFHPPSAESAVDGAALDVEAYYAQLSEWQEMSDVEFVDSLHESLLDAGIGEEAAEELRTDLLSILNEEFADEDDIGRDVLERLADQLRDAGVPEDQLEATVDQLMIAPLEESQDAAGDESGPGLDELVETARSMGMSEKKVRRLKNEAPELLEHLDPEALSDFEPQETYIREEPDIGRNERVTIEDPETGERETLKYKHALPKLEQGWRLLGG